MNKKFYSENIKEEKKLGDLSVDMRLGLCFDPEDGGDIFPINVG
jgi:hypothetical protein